jgi:glycosyltransferase involved in cell wall biosynthesis
MLKILQLYYEPLPSGQTTHVLTLTRELVQRGHAVSVVLPDYLKSTIVSFAQSGGRAMPLPLRKLVWKPAAVTGLVRLIRSEKFDVVHVHSQEAGIPGRLIARLAGARRIVYTPQTIDIWRVNFQRLYELIERALAYRTDRIISVNHQDRERLIEWGIPEHKVVTIPNGIETRHLQDSPALAQLRGITGAPEGSLIVMQIGRLSAQKDPLAFVEGATMVLRELPETHFVMVGEGPLRQAVLDKIHDFQLDANFHLTGRVENAAALLQIADLVTLTSRWEGLPYSLLEAMAYSKPFVTTEVNGIRDLIEPGPGGRIVPPGEIAAWSENVIALLKDPILRAELGERGREHLVASYTLAVMVDKIEKLYLDLVQNSQD